MGCRRDGSGRVYGHRTRLCPSPSADLYSQKADNRHRGPTARRTTHDDATASQITFTGRVIDAQGTPVAGAKATLYRSDNDESTSSSKTELLAEKTTGADGTFTFAVAKGTESSPVGYILVRKERLALSWAMWLLQDNQRMDITLGPGKELSGDVVDEKGQPIPEAEVSLTLAVIGEMKDNRYLASPVNLRASAAPLPVKTDDRGHFVFENMPVGATFEFQAPEAGPGHRPYIRPCRSGGKGEFSTGQSGIKIILPPEAIIQGVAVEKAGGKPVAGMTVMAMPQSRRHDPGAERAAPALTVSFVYGGLGPGTYWVQLLSARQPMPEWVAEPVPVSLEAGQTKGDVKLELTKGAIIEVLVKDGDGKPVAQAMWGCPSQRGGATAQFKKKLPRNEQMRMACARGSRQANIPSLEPTRRRTVSTTIWPRGNSPWRKAKPSGWNRRNMSRVPSRRPPAGGIPRSRGTARITGIVRDQAGNPLAGVEVQVVPTMRTQREEIRTDASGRFEIPADPRPSIAMPRPPVLVARDVAHNLAGSTEIEKDKTEGDLDLTLQPGLTVTGTVLSEEGRPLAGGRITVMLRPTPHSLWQLNRELIAIGADGTFEVKAPPGGPAIHDCGAG